MAEAGQAHKGALLVAQGPGQPEQGEQAVVAEAGDGRDLVALEGEHDQPVCVRYRARGIPEEVAERGLAVRARRYQPGRMMATPATGQVEPGNHRVPLVLSSNGERPPHRCD